MFKKTICLLATPLILTACGGGGGDSSPTPGFKMFDAAAKGRSQDAAASTSIGDLAGVVSTATVTNGATTALRTRTVEIMPSTTFNGSLVEPHKITTVDSNRKLNGAAIVDSTSISYTYYELITNVAIGNSNGSSFTKETISDYPKTVQVGDSAQYLVSKTYSDQAMTLLTSTGACNFKVAAIDMTDSARRIATFVFTCTTFAPNGTVNGINTNTATWMYDEVAQKVKTKNITTVTEDKLPPTTSLLTITWR